MASCGSMIGHGPNHDRSWTSMIGHGFKQNATGSERDMTGHGITMIGHENRQQCTVFASILPDKISFGLFFLQSILKDMKGTLNYKTSLFNLKIITKPTIELIAK